MEKGDHLLNEDDRPSRGLRRLGPRALIQENGV